MNNTVKETVSLLDILPENDQNLILEITKKLVLAWDKDFTKVTPLERLELEKARIEMEKGDFIKESDIDWS